jgi:hypothetical protein
LAAEVVLVGAEALVEVLLVEAGVVVIPVDHLALLVATSVVVIPVVEALAIAIDPTMVLFIATMLLGLGAWSFVLKTKHLKDLPIVKE